jgi:hypothetical protein
VPAVKLGRLVFKVSQVKQRTQDPLEKLVLLVPQALQEKLVSLASLEPPGKLESPEKQVPLESLEQDQLEPLEKLEKQVPLEPQEQEKLEPQEQEKLEPPDKQRTPDLPGKPE